MNCRSCDVVRAMLAMWLIGGAGAAKAAGPIVVCGVVTPKEAAAILGPLPTQPPSKTDNAGFGIYTCMYLGPAVSGQGAQTILTRLTVQAGSGRDVPDLMQADADKRRGGCLTTIVTITVG
jgi:hypothetical protein